MAKGGFADLLAAKPAEIKKIPPLAIAIAVAPAQAETLSATPPAAQAESYPETVAATPAATVPDALPASLPATSLPASVPAPAEASAKPSEPFTTLDSTHTRAEQSVYSQMYRGTIRKGFTDGRFSLSSLMKLTGIRSNNTVRRALDGLIAKHSIVILEQNPGDIFGTKYRVYSPKEITATRKSRGMEIDPVTKRIAIAAGIATTVAATPLVSQANRQSGERATASPSNASAAIAESDTHENKYNINPPVTPSIVAAPLDDEKLAKVRKLFEQLSNGGTWKDSRDNESYRVIAALNLFHITLGLCYSVTKSPEHRMSSLAYAVPSILKHAEDMGEYPDTVLGEIAYKTKRTTMNCIATGKWTVPEWLAGEGE